MSIRKAEIKDLETLYQIYMHESVISFMTFELMPLEEFRPIFEGFLQHSDVYIYQHKGQIVGTCRLEQGSGTRAHAAEICSVVVHHDHRRQGFGSKMLNALITKIKDEKPEIQRIELLVETDNSKAPDAYRKLGFQYEMTFDDLLRRYSGPREGWWYTGTMYMSMQANPEEVRAKTQKISDPIRISANAIKITTEQISSRTATTDDTESVIYFMRAHPDQTKAFSLDSLMKTKDVATKIQQKGLYICTDKNSGEIINLVFLAQLSRRLKNMGIITATISNPNYSNTVIADGLKQLKPQFYQRGIRHLHCQIPEGMNQLANILNAASFSNKGNIIAAHKTPSEEAYHDVMIFESRLFNFQDILEFAQVNHAFKKTPLLQANLAAKLSHIINTIQQSGLTDSEQLQLTNDAYLYLFTVQDTINDFENSDLPHLQSALTDTYSQEVIKNITNCVEAWHQKESQKTESKSLRHSSNFLVLNGDTAMPATTGQYTPDATEFRN